MSQVKSLILRVLRCINSRVDAWRVFRRYRVAYDGPWFLSRVLKYATELSRNYGYSFEEYLGYHLGELSNTEQMSFVNDFDHEIFSMIVNSRDLRNLLDNKYETYNRFRSYYGRELLNIESSSYISESLYHDFAIRHKRFIVKPHNAALGIGCRIVDDPDGVLFHSLYESYSDVKHSFLIGYSKYNGFLCEELVRANSKIEAFHPESLNTFRIATIKLPDGTVAVKHACFRMGRGGAAVDNAGAGGILCAVNLKTGVLSCAVDELGHKYEKHPDSGIVIKGFKVPLWEKAMEFVKGLGFVLDGLSYGAWDVALTHEGEWVMIEANYDGQFIWQYPEHKGCRDEMNEWLSLLNVNLVMDRPLALNWELLRDGTISNEALVNYVINQKSK